MNLYNLHNEPRTLDKYDEVLQFPEFAYGKLKDDYYEEHTDEKLLHVISKSAEYSYKWANYCDKRFALGENAISKDPGFAYRYARDVLHSRFALGEEAIATDGRASFFYAKYILHDRFELGENSIRELILQNMTPALLNVAVTYAVEIMHERWDEEIENKMFAAEFIGMERYKNYFGLK